MIAMTDVRRLANGAAARLKMMGKAVDGIDRDLALLEERRARAGPGEAATINRRIRELADARLAGGEIMAEGERQSAEASAKMVAATKEACRNVHSIAREAERAAERFDQAMADALAALDEIEAAFAPGEGVLLPGSRRFGFPAINQAFLAAFASRRGRLAEYNRGESMGVQVRDLISAARQSAAELEKRGYTWGGN